MKFCYLDESGTGDEPFAVMVGVIVDAKRMHKTKAEWQNLLANLSAFVDRPITEIHTRDFYPGNSPWRDLDGPVRAHIIDQVFDWLAERKHRVVFSVVDRSRFDDTFADEETYEDLESLWRFLATHIVLCLQKRHQRLGSNKGHTLMVFDNEHMERSGFRDLIRHPPEWTDTYYDRSGSQQRLNQIIDVPYFGDSKEVGLIQLADFAAYFLRRHIELQEGASAPRYEGEKEKVANWFDKIEQRLVNSPVMYKKQARCECADLFYRYAPSLVDNL